MISVFDLFKIGIGPSSSHTVGPMKAAAEFAAGLELQLTRVARVEAVLYGSLAWTGKGHATDRAIVLGWSGQRPETIDGSCIHALVACARDEGRLVLTGLHAIAFSWARDIVFDCATQPPRHPNTLQFTAYDNAGQILAQERWCSVGGGFVVREDASDAPMALAVPEPYVFAHARELLGLGARHRLSIADVVLANECSLQPRAQVERKLQVLAQAMLACVERGLQTTGELPGGLKVRRRAAGIFAQLQAARFHNAHAAHEVMDFISVFAIAVNEENAAGGQVVTAPTNGAAGVVPAVLRYYRDFCPGACEAGYATFLLTAAAIGALFKMNASISGAEVGCQGEVGVACSMAAAGLAAVLGGTNEQIENAAEIGMEHHLGMTCDPIGGLVQIPCIERNAFGAVKAVNAASLALRGDGTHVVSLDQVIATMRQTGADMHHKYKETSLGGLAVNFVEC